MNSIALCNSSKDSITLSASSRVIFFSDFFRTLKFEEEKYMLKSAYG